MKLPETQQGLLSERDSWESIINSPDWVVYRTALREHVIFLQKKVNAALREQKFTEAYGHLIAMEDSNIFLDSISIRLKALNERIEQ